MEDKTRNLYIKVAIINLALVALVGTLMRYKIGFEFPHLDQKYLMHAHSHFAFSGWVTHALFVFMVLFLKNHNKNHKIYQGLIITNLISAFGMLISFTIQGYGAVSVTFSTLSIFVGYVFAYYYYSDLRGMPDHPSKNWFKAALLFNVLSSIGTFYLAYMMISKSVIQHVYLGSVYFYLHFQYSGWFFFAIIGLIIDKFSGLRSFKNDPKIFYLFFTACIPAYFLSILWAKLPWYLFLLPVFAVVLQLWGLRSLIKIVLKHIEQIKSDWSKTVQWLFALTLFALVIKLSLQAGSVIPELSKLAYSFRSIVIAYLHLVLLAFTSLFLLGYMLLSGYIASSKHVLQALVIFSIGVFANEFVLMVQGVASFGYILIPYLNETLFGISAAMFLSLIYLFFSNNKV